MPTVNITRAAEAAITISLNSLSNNGVATSNAIVPAAGDHDHHVRVTIGQITPSGSVQAVFVYAIGSNDGATFSDNNRAANRRLLGTIDLTSMSQARSRHFSVAAAFDGFLPTQYKLVCEDQAGVALAASGNSAGFVAVGVQTA